MQEALDVLGTERGNSQHDSEGKFTPEAFLKLFFPPSRPSDGRLQFQAEVRWNQCSNLYREVRKSATGANFYASLLFFST